jgi:peptide subunit release factor 1 (eRF1)
MKLLDRDQLETLAGFQDGDAPTTSFFLDTSKNRLSKKEIQLSLKNLLFTSRSKVEGMDLPKYKKDSLYQDLDRIKDFCSRNLSAYSYVGLALFSCSRSNFWQEFNLVKSPRNQVIFDSNPYVRPLSAIIDEYHRTCLVTFDGKEARWYKIFMGEITLQDSLESKVPGKVREGGWEGYSSKRIERHRSSLLHEFLKQAAKKTFHLMKNGRHEWLFLGCQDDYCQELEPLLHPDVQKKLKTRLRVKPGDSPGKILKVCLEAKDRLKKQEKDKLVKRFAAELGRDGLAVSGLGYTLRTLNRGEVHTLLVTRHFSEPGRKCPKCRFLFQDEEVCPSCRVKTSSLVDIIDEAVETALGSSCQVTHINPPSRLDELGGIGAFLRYKA